MCPKKADTFIVIRKTGFFARTKLILKARKVRYIENVCSSAQIVCSLLGPVTDRFGNKGG